MSKKEMFDGMADVIENAAKSGIEPEDVLGVILLNAGILMNAIGTDQASASNSGMKVTVNVVNQR